MLEEYIHNIAIDCANKIQGEEKYSELKYAKIVYSVEMLISEGSKILIIMMVFILLGKLFECAFCFCVLLVTRCFTGGVHAKTYVGCLCLSLLFFGGAVYVKENIELNIDIMTFMLFVYVLFVCIIAPIQSENRIKFDKRNRYIQKMVAIIWAVVIYFLVKKIYFQYLVLLIYVYWFQLFGGIYVICCKMTKLYVVYKGGAFMKRIFLNKVFWLAVVPACLLLFCSVVYTDIDSGQQYLFISLLYDKVPMEALEYGFISLGDIFWGYDSSYLWMFCPIIVGIPCVIVKKTERFALFRTTKNKYFLSKYFSTIIAGGAIMFFAYLIFGLICNWMSKESILNIYFVKKLLSVFVWGVTSSIPATILSEFVRSKYLILCIPFVINYFLNIFLYRFIPESIREYVMPDSFITLFLREDKAIKGCLIYTVIIVFSCALLKKIIAERRCDCGC